MEIQSIKTWMDEDAQLLTESWHMLCIVKLWKSTWNCCSPTSLLVCRHSEMSLYVCTQSDTQCPIPFWQSSPLIRAFLVVSFFCVCACVSVWVWIVVRLRGRNRCRKSKRHSAAAAAGSNPPIQLAFFSPVGSSSSQRLGSRVSQKEVAKEGRLHMHLKFFATTKPATRKKKKLEKKTSNDLLPSLFLFCATFSH